MELLNIADKKVVSYLRSGERIDLRIKRNRIFALNGDNQFIGMLPDDICQRLIKFINAGNQYEAYIRKVDNNRVSVFIRETKRVKKFRDQPSFVNNIVPRAAEKSDKKKSQSDESL